MTKDGLIERDAVTGEEVRISQRGQDFRLRPDKNERQSFAKGYGSKPKGKNRKQRPLPVSDDRPISLEELKQLYDGQSPYSEEAPAREAPEGSPTHHSLRDSPSSADTYGRERSRLDDTPAAADTYVLESFRSDDPPAVESVFRRHEWEPDFSLIDDRAPVSDKKKRKPFDAAAKPLDDTATQSDAAADTQAGENAAQPNQKPGSSGRLRFSPEESSPKDSASAPDASSATSPAFRRLDKAKARAEAAGVNLDAARENLPTKYRPRLEREIDPEAGTVSRRFHFEKVAKSQYEHIRGPLPLRPFKAGANFAVGFAHKKIYQVEDQNVGVKAAHKAELLAESGLRSALRFRKTAPYRRVEKARRKSVKTSLDLSYRQAVADNPRLQSSMLSRYMQKRRIKKQYAKAARDARRAGLAAGKIGAVLAKTAIAVKLKAAVAAIAAGKAKVAVIAGLALLLVFFISTLVSSCSTMITGGFSAILSSSYLAEDEDINDASVLYTRWENELRLQIENAEQDHPGFDEYRFDIGDIGHDPRELMAFLTALYHDFRFADVYATLRELFDEQYTLEFTPEVEIRTRTVTRTDPVTGDSYEEEEEYEWHILNTVLTSIPFSEVIAGRMDDEQRGHFEVIMDSGGNRQYVGSPFAFDWRPYITSHFGYRLNPLTGAPEFHTGIDIAPAAGTPIIAAHDGIVTAVVWGTTGYGHYILLTGENGIVTRYAHCQDMFVSVGQEVSAGDVIATVGSTGDSTGPHLHFEVLVHGRLMNPIFFSHFE